MDTRSLHCVLRSNAPALHDEPSTVANPSLPLPHEVSLAPQERLESKAFDHPPLCFTCHQAGHDPQHCRLNIFEDSVGFAGLQHHPLHALDLDISQYSLDVPTLLPSPPLHSAQAAIKREHRSRPRYLRSSRGERDRCEENSPLYLEYRRRARAKKSERAGPWNDIVEEAFQYAIREWGGQGRTKRNLHTSTRSEKLSGGNEFISASIEEQTGVKLDRKKVSSHIQVLKHKCADNPCWMSHVVGISDLRKGRKGGHNGRSRAEGTERFIHKESARVSRSRYQSPQPLPSAGPLILKAFNGPNIHRVKFEMKLCEKPKVGATSRLKYHTYTQIQSEIGSAPQSFDHVADFSSMHPHLDPYDESGKPISVYLFDAGMKLMERHVPSTQLEVVFNIIMNGGAVYRDWSLRTRLCDGQGFVEEDEKHGLMESRLDDQALNLTLHLHTKYWLNTFFEYMQAQEQAQAAGDAHGLQQREGYQQRFMSGITVRQEIWARSLSVNEQPKRMAILLWKFHQTSRNETPTTSWRHLMPPSYLEPAQSPTSRRMHSAVHGVPTPQSVGSPQRSGLRVHTESYDSCHPNNLLADETSSLESGCQDHNGSSLPSSISTSFPSTISDSTYHTQPSQHTSFCSQNGIDMYPSFEGLDSHESAYGVDVQNGLSESHNAAGIDQDHHTYAVEQMLYNSQAPSFPYEVPPGFSACQFGTQEVIEGTVMHPYQDFTGGPIHISYDDVIPNLHPQKFAPPQHEVPQQSIEQYKGDQDAYVSPLVAPRPKMSQPQILQEQYFEQLQNITPPCSNPESDQTIQDVVKREPASPIQAVLNDVGVVPGQQKPGGLEGPDELHCENPEQQDQQPNEFENGHALLNTDIDHQDGFGHGRSQHHSAVNPEQINSHHHHHLLDQEHGRQPMEFRSEKEDFLLIQNRAQVESQTFVWDSSQQSDRLILSRENEDINTMSFDGVEDFDYITLENWHGGIDPDSFNMETDELQDGRAIEG